jgi:CRISPR-associated protein (TIGR03985 family)
MSLYIDPTPDNLQHMLGPKSILTIPPNGKLNGTIINTGTFYKAIRMWCVLNVMEDSKSQSSEMQADYKQWFLDKYKEQTTRDILYLGKPAIDDLWKAWKEEFFRYQEQLRLTFSTDDLEEFRPFSCSKKAFSNNFDYLLHIKLIKRELEDNKNTKTSHKIYVCDDENISKMIESAREVSKNRSIAYQYTEQTNLLSIEKLTTVEKYGGYISRFSSKIRDIYRLYIYSDYEPNSIEKKEGIQNIQKDIYTLWKMEITPPVCIRYHSSSQGEYEAIVYPVVIHFYQRGFYLRAIVSKKGSSENNWRNYKIDKIRRIEPLSWKDTRVSDDFRTECHSGKNDQDLICKIEKRMEEAYGFDIEKDDKEMILRFNRKFHDSYIKDVWRHNTFEKIERSELVEYLSNHGTRLNEEDAYYTMQYRDDDNTVIMRLRAWGQNVEVLSPPELRQRMHDDLKLTWAMYSDDPDPNSDR